MDIATLGYAVDTSGLDKGQTALDRFKQSNDQVAQSVQKAQDSTSGYEGVARRTGETVDQVRARFAALNAATGETGNVFKLSQTAVGQFAPALNLASTAATAHAAATRGMAAEHAAASSVTKEFRETLHALDPILRAAGLNVAGLGQFAMAARGGVEALGVAIAGYLVLKLAEAGDAAVRTKLRLEGLAGVKLGDKLTADLNNIAKQLHLQPEAVGPAYEAIVKLQQQYQKGFGIRSVPGMEEFAPGIAGANQFASTIKTVNELLRIWGADEKTATAATNEFFQSIAKNNGITVEAFNKLESAAPGAGAALARAMNASSVAEFVASIEKAPASFQRLVNAAVGIGPATDETFRHLEEHPRTVGQAVDGMTNSFTNFWKKLSEGSETKNFVILAFQAMDASLQAMADSMGGGEARAKSLYNAMNSLGAKAREVAGDIAAAFAAAYSGKTDANGNAYNGPGEGYVEPGSDYYGSFATGGSFVVGGSGGTDSQLVQFMATPGEGVSVVPAGATGNLLTDSQRNISTNAIPGATNLNATDPLSAAVGGNASLANQLQAHANATTAATYASGSAIVGAVGVSADQVTTSIAQLKSLIAQSQIVNPTGGTASAIPGLSGPVYAGGFGIPTLAGVNFGGGGGGGKGRGGYDPSSDPNFNPNGGGSAIASRGGGFNYNRIPNNGLKGGIGGSGGASIMANMRRVGGAPGGSIAANTRMVSPYADLLDAFGPPGAESYYYGYDSSTSFFNDSYYDGGGGYDYNPLSYGYQEYDYGGGMFPADTGSGGYGGQLSADAGYNDIGGGDFTDFGYYASGGSFTAGPSGSITGGADPRLPPGVTWLSGSGSAVPGSWYGPNGAKWSDLAGSVMAPWGHGATPPAGSGWSRSMDRGTDTIHGLIHLTPGETVNVTKPGETSSSSSAGKFESRTSSNTFNFYGSGGMNEFNASRAQMRRQARLMMG